MLPLSPSGPRTARRVILAGMGLCVCLSCLAANGTLVEHSPFLPPGWGEEKEVPTPVVTTAPAIISRQLEFKGLIEMNGVTRFSIFDKKNNVGHWLALNESVGDFEIVRYDEKKPSILIRSGGRTEEIGLATPDDIPVQISGSATASVSRSPGGARPSVSISSSGSSNTRTNAPRIPRRRIVRPSDNSDTAKNEKKLKETPSNPLPAVPSS